MLEIIKYNANKHKILWDLFVLKSNNGTIFHSRKFLSYHKERNFQDCSFLFQNKNNVEALFTGAIIDDVLYSHPGASFGGFIYNQLSFEFGSKIVELLLEFAQQNNLKEIVIVPTPFIYYNQYNEVIEYCLYIKGFSMIEYYISSFVNLESNLLDQLHNRKKRYIKKMENEIEIKLSKDLDGFYPILVNNKLKHKTKPTHTLEELKVLMQQFPDEIKLLLSYQNNKIIGGALNFITNKNSCILFYNMIDYEYQSLQVASLQIYASLKWAQENNLKFLDIGVSQLYEGDKIVPHESLINFKEQFGAKAMIRKVMKLNL
tara:strand:+ start:871 stop:1821 length:951 start_codon:yes stop_codon:yes gene_type:complete